MKNTSFEKQPGRGESGSIEQQLDMNESGPLRGDDISHQAHRYGRGSNVDMSEYGREGDEMSGDDHSSGMQGGEPELSGQPHISTGMPGDETRTDELKVDEAVAREEQDPLDPQSEGAA